MVGPQAHIVLQVANVGRWHKAGAQQAVGVQCRSPLAVEHIGLAPGQVLGLAAVDHYHFQTCGFQYAIQGQPVHAGGLHCYRAHFVRQQPVAQGMQLRRHRTEDCWRPACNRHMHLFPAHVDEGRVRIQHW
ncbi:hypothetical protein D3C72_1275630 [compost metagenome]